MLNTISEDLHLGSLERNFVSGSSQNSHGLYFPAEWVTEGWCPEGPHF